MSPNARKKSQKKATATAATGDSNTGSNSAAFDRVANFSRYCLPTIQRTTAEQRDGEWTAITGGHGLNITMNQLPELPAGALGDIHQREGGEAGDQSSERTDHVQEDNETLEQGNVNGNGSGSGRVAKAIDYFEGRCKDGNKDTPLPYSPSAALERNFPLFPREEEPQEQDLEDTAAAADGAQAGGAAPDIEDETSFVAGHPNPLGSHPVLPAHRPRLPAPVSSSAPGSAKAELEPNTGRESAPAAAARARRRNRLSCVFENAREGDNLVEFAREVQNTTALPVPELEVAGGRTALLSGRRGENRYITIHFGSAAAAAAAATTATGPRLGGGGGGASDASSVTSSDQSSGASRASRASRDLSKETNSKGNNRISTLTTTAVHGSIPSSSTPSSSLPSSPSSSSQAYSQGEDVDPGSGSGSDDTITLDQEEGWIPAPRDPSLHTAARSLGLRTGNTTVSRTSQGRYLTRTVIRPVPTSSRNFSAAGADADADADSSRSRTRNLSRAASNASTALLIPAPLSVSKRKHASPASYPSSSYSSSPAPPRAAAAASSSTVGSTILTTAAASGAHGSSSQTVIRHAPSPTSSLATLAPSLNLSDFSSSSSSSSPSIDAVPAHHEIHTATPVPIRSVSRADIFGIAMSRRAAAAKSTPDLKRPGQAINESAAAAAASGVASIPPPPGGGGGGTTDPSTAASRRAAVASGAAAAASGGASSTPATTANKAASTLAFALPEWEGTPAGNASSASGRSRLGRWAEDVKWRTEKRVMSWKWELDQKFRSFTDRRREGGDGSGGTRN
ncbi:hypothetical protein MKZ38_006207 [Zalerion maritima]|uniref:Uncharacterized protein n=1 Tax=Zalerion maritima TaxID=339359 RepID=A0AAD5RK63_9PEZI|nr:hypothetical protein MKZ38_006207 [Zalerion maritima]